MNKSRTVTMTAFGAITLVGLTVVAMPASAATGPDGPVKNDQGQCLIGVVHHDEVSHQVPVITPGTDAVTHEEQRWSREVPGVDEVNHEETQFYRVIPGLEQITHDEWYYSRFVEGNKEVSHLEYQFSRQNPGQSQEKHKEYQFSRSNPGQQEKSHQEYKYQKVTKASHKEYKYKKTIKVYTIEHKKVQVPSYGRDRDRVISWLTSIGASNLGGDWWQLPDSVVAAAGVNPFNVAQSGNVNLGAYGMPNGVTVSYQITGIETFDQPPAGSFVSIGNQTVYYTGGSSFSLNAGDAIWTAENLSGWTQIGNRTVQDPDVIEYYNGGNWTTDVNPAGWTKIDQRKVIDQAYIAPYTEYRKQDGTGTANQAEAGWFTQTSFSGWTQFNHRLVIDQEYVAPFTEYRAQDGSATTDVNNAGWFPESSFSGWNSYGDPKKVVTQEATEDQTFYLTRDAEGNLGESTNPEDAAVFSSNDPLESSDGVDTNTWTEFGRETFTDQEATPDKTVYLTEVVEGVIGETEDPEQASWVLPNDPYVDLTVWKQMVNDHGDPLIRTVVDQEAIPAYTEYYVSGGEPTRVLGDSNWTTDEPEGWTFVDDREVTDKEAIPGTITYTKVVDKAAWDEEKWGACGLAMTGSNDPWGPSGLGTIGTGILIAGAALAGGAAIARRRARHLATPETIS